MVIHYPVVTSEQVEYRRCKIPDCGIPGLFGMGIHMLDRHESQ